MDVLPYAVAAWLFLIGVYGVATSPNYIHMILCLQVVQGSTSLMLVSIGYRRGAGPPVVAGGAKLPAVDPVVQAMTLTDIVVGTTVTALLLAMAIQAQKRSGTLDPDRLRPLSG